MTRNGIGLRSPTGERFDGKDPQVLPLRRVIVVDQESPVRREAVRMLDRGRLHQQRFRRAHAVGGHPVEVADGSVEREIERERDVAVWRDGGRGLQFPRRGFKRLKIARESSAVHTRAP